MERIMKKYKLTDETREVGGATLYRICALRDFSTVKAGDLGGWVQSEKNLSQNGLCWMSGNSRMYGNGIIGGKMFLSGDASLKAAPIYIQGTQYWLGYCGEPGMIRSGCINKPIEWWLEHVEQCGGHEGYSEIEQREYRMHFEHVAAWMKLYGLDKEGA